METISFISIAGLEVQLPDRQDYTTHSTEILNRKVLKMHVQHVASWLLRGLAVSYLFYLGSQVVEGMAGKAIIWTAGILLACLLVYIWKGHRDIQRYRRAKIYWLLNDTSGNEFGLGGICQEKPGQAQEPVRSPDAANSGCSLGEQVLS